MIIDFNLIIKIWIHLIINFIVIIYYYFTATIVIAVIVITIIVSLKVLVKSDESLVLLIIIIVINFNVELIIVPKIIAVQCFHIAMLQLFYLVLIALYNNNIYLINFKFNIHLYIIIQCYKLTFLLKLLLK